VVTDPAAGLTVQSLRADSAAYLEPYMVPAQVILCDSLPKSPNGKVNKRILAAEDAAACSSHTSLA
jgi:acyl-coenzyme A synthetase/AMP-(fatty) acid ligase